MNAETCDAIVESFNNDTDVIGSKGRVLEPSPQILIGTIDLIEVGFTCARAFRLVLIA